MAYNNKFNRRRPASTDGGQTNSRFAPRGPQRFGANPNPMPSDGGGGFGEGGFSNRQDPRYVNPNPMPTAGNRNFNNNMGQQTGGSRFAPRGAQQFGMGAGNTPASDNIGGNSNRQDPRFANNPNQGSSNQQDPRFASGRRPAGLPNVNMRKPGSGGSRVMRRPTVGSLRNGGQNRLQSGRFPAGNSNSKKMGY